MFLSMFLIGWFWVLSEPVPFSCLLMDQAWHYLIYPIECLWLWLFWRRSDMLERHKFLPLFQPFLMRDLKVFVAFFVTCSLSSENQVLSLMSSLNYCSAASRMYIHFTFKLSLCSAACLIIVWLNTAKHSLWSLFSDTNSLLQSTQNHWGLFKFCLSALKTYL